MRVGSRGAELWFTACWECHPKPAELLMYEVDLVIALVAASSYWLDPSNLKVP